MQVENVGRRCDVQLVNLVTHHFVVNHHRAPCVANVVDVVLSDCAATQPDRTTTAT